MRKIVRKQNSGFTLAELLIVVAIIGVLVAISIPIFSSQLEKSREATDLANIRSAYAECSASVLSEEKTGNADYDADTGAASEVVKITQKKAGWENSNKDATIGGQALPEITSSTTQVTVTVNADGSVTIE